MFRTLRAFAWMRWRVLMNSIERTGTRDTLERLSLAVEQIGPLIALGLMLPSAALLAVLGGYAGYLLPGAERVTSFNAIRILLGVATGFCVLGPILLPTMERTSAVRLLLLPIPQRVLYVAQASGALSDPWLLLAVPLLLGIPVGLALHGALAGAAIAVLASLALITTLVGLSALTAFALHLLVRDRRRGELVTLLVVIILPAIGLLPSLLITSKTRAERRAEEIARAERLARGEETRLERAARVAARAYMVLPSELAARATKSTADGDAGAALAPLAGLAVTGLAFHGVAFAAFGRLLAAPGSASRRQSVAATPARHAWIPGLSRAEAAVAQAQLRLALRTPRGRSMLISPLIVFAMFAALALRQREVELGHLSLNGGLMLTAFGCAICLLSILPFALNQFAVDRAGLTLTLLSPISDRDLLIGKAVGNGLIAAIPAVLCLVIAYAVFRDGPLALWVNIVPAFIATYATSAPAAAALSAIFPRSVNLNSIGRGSNAHGLASFIGMLTMLAAGLPAAALTFVFARIVGSPVLALVFVTAWSVVALVGSRLLFGVVASIFERRRENLGMVNRQ
jgi:hypothetical protein